jgi:hypothetical protein
MAKFGEKSKKDILAANAQLPVVKKEIDYKADTEEDYEYARTMYKELLETGKTSLQSLVALAAESEHPRAFEVLSNSIKNLSDVTGKLIDLQKDVKDVNKAEAAQPTTSGLTQNNMFFGSTTDLQKMLRGHISEKVLNAEDTE